MNRTFRRGLTVVALAGALSASLITMASAATTDIHGRNAVGNISGSAKWLSSAEGNTIDNNSLRGRGGVQENVNGNLKRVRIYDVKTQQLRNGSWVTVQHNPTDKVNESARAYTVSGTSPTSYCFADPGLMRTYRVVNAYGVRKSYAPYEVVNKTVISNTFQARALITDPACVAPPAPPAPPTANLQIDVQGSSQLLHEENQDIDVRVRNLGPSTAGNTNAVVDFDDNAGLVVDSNDPRAQLRTSTSDPNDYVIALGPFHYGDDETIRFNVDGDLVGSTTVAAFVDGSTDIAPRPHDDDSLTVNVVKAADLSLAKSVDTGYIHSGDSVTYTFAVHNAGPDVAREVVIDDNWPAALASNLQVTGAVNWSLTADDRLVINLGNIASGGTDVVTVTASASSDTPTTVRNVASITDSADVYDRDSADRTDDATFDIGVAAESTPVDESPSVPSDEPVKPEAKQAPVM